MQFSEANGAWQPIPGWARFLIRFGYEWSKYSPEARRICLISMPCDSAAAGLVTLGALCRRLELDDANDLTSHFQRLVALVGCADETCLFHLKSRKSKTRGPYMLEGLDSSGMLWVRLMSSPDVRRTISPATACEWQINDEPVVQAVSGEQIPFQELYAELMECEGALQINLTRSDSGICLAGRVAGQQSTKDTLACVHLRAAGRVADLSDLLTIQGWSPGNVSRVSFFNTRTGEFDRNPGWPKLVVVDGDAAFLKVCGKEEFSRSDIVAVTHRIVERDRLEMLGSKLAELGQWYVHDGELLDILPTLPQGIAVTILKGR